MASPRGGGHETVTLQAETQTPRRRTLVASFVRQRTPPGELPLGRRKRLKAESSARSRAMCRLDPEKHDQYLVKERERKTLSRGVQYGPWRQKACERIRAERDRSRAEQNAATDQMLIAEREERGQIGSRGSKHKAVRQGPPGWCDTRSGGSGRSMAASQMCPGSNSMTALRVPHVRCGERVGPSYVVSARASSVT